MKGAVLVRYDGYCNLCSAAVRFVVRHDHSGQIRFAPLPVGGPPESIVVSAPDGEFLRSDGLIRIGLAMGGVWAVIAMALRVVPRALRDLVYAWVARNRIRWFGSRKKCFITDPADRARFIPSPDE